MTTVGQLLSEAQSLISLATPYTTKHISPLTNQCNVEAYSFIQSTALEYTNDSINEWEIMLTARYGMIRVTLVQAQNLLNRIATMTTNCDNNFDQFMKLLMLYRDFDNVNNNNINLVNYIGANSILSLFSQHTKFYTALVQYTYYQSKLGTFFIPPPSPPRVTPSLHLNNAPPYLHQYDGLLYLITIWAQMTSMYCTGGYEYRNECEPREPCLDTPSLTPLILEFLRPTRHRGAKSLTPTIPLPYNLQKATTFNPMVTKEYLNIQPKFDTITQFSLDTPNEHFVVAMNWKSSSSHTQHTNNKINQEGVLPAQHQQQIIEEITLDRMTSENEIDCQVDKKMLNSMSLHNLNQIYTYIFMNTTTEHFTSQTNPTTPNNMTMKFNTTVPQPLLGNILHQLGPHLPTYTQLFTQFSNTMNNLFISDAFFMSKLLLDNVSQLYSQFQEQQYPTQTPQAQYRTIQFNTTNITQLALLQASFSTTLISRLQNVPFFTLPQFNPSTSLQRALFPLGFMTHADFVTKYTTPPLYSNIHKYAISTGLVSSSPLSSATTTITLTPSYQSPYDIFLHMPQLQHTPTPKSIKQYSHMLNLISPLITKSPTSTFTLQMKSASLLTQLFPNGLNLIPPPTQQQSQQQPQGFVSIPQLILDPPVIIPITLFTSMLKTAQNNQKPTTTQPSMLAMQFDKTKAFTSWSTPLTSNHHHHYHHISSMKSNNNIDDNYEHATLLPPSMFSLFTSDHTTYYEHIVSPLHAYTTIINQDEQITSFQHRFLHQQQQAGMSLPPGHQNIATQHQFNLLSKFFTPFLPPHDNIIFSTNKDFEYGGMGANSTLPSIAITPSLSQLIRTISLQPLYYQQQFYHYISQSPPIVVRAIPTELFYNPSTNDFNTTHLIDFIAELMAMVYSTQAMFSTNIGIATPPQYYQLPQQTNKSTQHVNTHVNPPNTIGNSDISFTSGSTQRCDISSLPPSEMTDNVSHCSSYNFQNDETTNDFFNDMLECVDLDLLTISSGSNKNNSSSHNNHSHNHNANNTSNNHINNDNSHTNTSISHISSTLLLNSQGKDTLDKTLHLQFAPVAQHISQLDFSLPIVYSIATDFTSSIFASIPRYSSPRTSKPSTPSNINISTLISFTTSLHLYSTSYYHPQDPTVIVNSVPLTNNIIDTGHIHAHDAVHSALKLNNTYTITPANNNAPFSYHFTINTTQIPLQTLLVTIVTQYYQLQPQHQPIEQFRPIIPILTEIVQTIQAQSSSQPQSNDTGAQPQQPIPNILTLPTFPGLFTITVYNKVELSPTTIHTIQHVLQFLPIIYLVSRSLPLLSSWLSAVFLELFN